LFRIYIVSLFSLLLLGHYPFSDFVLNILDLGSVSLSMQNWGLYLIGLSEIVSVTALCVLTVKSR
jgi:hypothetical protein